MSKYMLLSSGGSMPETEAEQAEVMKAWGAWYDKLGSAVVDPGNPLAPVASVKSDGSVGAEGTGSMPNGYIILEAESRDRITEMAKTCPVLEGGSDISIFEAIEMM